jgi:xanthine dehydrogenase accessory factor
MEEVYEQIDSLSKIEKRVAMATVVATRGTSPKKEGAKMWVGEAGHVLGSVTIGGCVDARVIEESERVLASVKPRLLSVSLGEEDAWEVGFACAGTVDVLIEPVDLTDPEDQFRNLYATVRGEVEAGKCVIVATLLERASSKLLILEDGRTIGGLGSTELDLEAQRMSSDLIHKRASRTVALDSERSSKDVFFEVHGPTPTLIVFGAGHVSMRLVSLAKVIGLRTVVVDGRPRFATRERFPDADDLLIGIPSEIARNLTYTSSTIVVLAAHDYKFDIPVLKIVLRSSASYIGMLGSKRRGQAILNFLREGGVNEADLNRVRVPTGLDIGAVTANEIALSILAEAVAVRSGRPGSPMREPLREATAALYSDVILDHFRNPRNFGSLSCPDITHEGLNPLCGDRIRIELRLSEGVIETARFQGDGCAISLASASLLTELIHGARIDDGELISNDLLLASLESDIKPARINCALLPLEVLRSGVRTHMRFPPAEC